MLLRPPLTPADTWQASACLRARPLPLRTRCKFLHTLRAKRPCTRAHVLPSACHCEPVPYTRAHVLPSACHCEPVRTLAWQSASPGRNVVHCTCARLRAHLPSLSLHTSAHTGVAIRFPAAAESGKQHFRRIRNCPRIRPKHCSFSLSLRVKRIAPLLRSLQ